MQLHTLKILTDQQVAHCRKVLDEAEWVSGKTTAGWQASKVKNNMQVPESHSAARQLGELIMNALESHPLFMSAALPLKILPPRFNRYQGGESYGSHVDTAIMQMPKTQHSIRTDLSATLFLSAPDEYDGGELILEGPSGGRRTKLPAGEMALYSANSVHNVQPVTRGSRIASIFWIQSMVRDDGERAILFDLDLAINKVRGATPENPVVTQFTNIYSNLLRRWADA